jgi:hypothetical protein
MLTNEVTMSNPILSSASLALAALLACLPASPAHADRHHVGHRYTKVVVGPGHYWYRNGVYYKRHHGRYLYVAPPRGALIATVPSAAVRLRFGGTRYRYFGGAYYHHTPRGFVVVERPATVYLDRVATAPDTVFVEPVYRLVNVRNTNGSTTPVRLEQAGEKWQGPKGEFYDAFPTDDQLRSAYGF